MGRYRDIRRAPDVSPPLRHVWPTFARVATAWRFGQCCRNLGRAAGNKARSRKARDGPRKSRWGRLAIRHAGRIDPVIRPSRK